MRDRDQENQYGAGRSADSRHKSGRRAGRQGSQGAQGAPNYGRVTKGEDYGSSGTSQYGRSTLAARHPDEESDGSGVRPGQSGQHGESGQSGDRGPQHIAQGQHRGKGPRGYQRSDERRKELVSEALSDHPEIDASDITVDVKEGRVTLEGSVDSRKTKNAVEDVAEHFCQDVQNNLRVNR